MSGRLKVLISAYACEPGKGSEPEVGWQWSLQMARFHDVLVLTRANNRLAIESALKTFEPGQPRPAFAYHDEAPFLLDLKKTLHATKLYYLFWQRSARDVVAQLHEAHRFDLFHHVTFAGFRYPTAVWGHGVPCVWGPIGGIESVPTALLPWRHLKSLIHEIGRNTNNLLQAAPFHMLPRRARVSTLILASTFEMQRTFSRLGFETRVMPTIGLNPRELPEPAQRHGNTGPLKLLFVGNVITLKGIDLAIRALKESGSGATLTLIGDGDFSGGARRLVSRLQLEGQVSFLGRLPRAEVLKRYSEYDVFIFPSLHDTGGYAVIEAMFYELPVICLKCGGPAVTVDEDCGMRIPLGARQEVVSNLAAAIRQYGEDRALIRRHGRASREKVLRDYDWTKKGEQMNEVYKQAVERANSPKAGSRATGGYSGLGSTTTFLHRMFSFRGLLITLLALFFVGMLGFASLTHLRNKAQEIVDDTLPGLAYAGAANNSMAEGFDRTLMMLIADTAEERSALIRDIERFNRRTTTLLRAYSQSIFSPEDRLNFDEVATRRERYQEIRRKVIALANERRRDAISLCNGQLVPAYTSYKQAAEKLLAYNMKQSEERGKTIMTVCSATQVLVAIIGIGIFILGFLIGLFK